MHSIRRVATWEKTPGNWDTLNFQKTFPSNNEYGIPTIANNAVMPSQLVQWGSRPQLLTVGEGGNAAVHFFLDDYRFESLWRNPLRNLDALQRIGIVLSPDFSLFRDMPTAMQIWNVYRNRWLACFWQQYGIQIIPTISWSNPYDFCYAGVEPGSIVAVSSVGVMQDRSARRMFRVGFEKMLEVLRPAAILSYGSLTPLVATYTPVVTFPTRWEQRPKVQTRVHTEQLLSLWGEVAHA